MHVCSSQGTSASTAMHQGDEYASGTHRDRRRRDSEATELPTERRPSPPIPRAFTRVSKTNPTLTTCTPTNSQFSFTSARSRSCLCQPRRWPTRLCSPTQCGRGRSPNSCPCCSKKGRSKEVVTLPAFIKLFRGRNYRCFSSSLKRFIIKTIHPPHSLRRFDLRVVRNTGYRESRCLLSVDCEVYCGSPSGAALTQAHAGLPRASHGLACAQATTLCMSLTGRLSAVCTVGTSG